MVQTKISAPPIVEAILHGMRDKKAQDITLLNVGKIPNTVTDYFVICSGTSDRQTGAIADAVRQAVKSATGERPYRSEGERSGEWILLDYVDVVVHIFLPRMREFYQLEELWADAERTDWPS